MLTRHPLLFALKPLLTLLAAATASTLNANPQTPQVVSGQATFSQTGKSLTVTNSPGAIINWQQFNIDRGELTRFVQQNAASQVLNRVVGVNPSAILGTLQSNGRVFLVNPNGIMFGAGSQVDVAGLVASTLKISNADFLNNRLRFGDTPGAAGISNAGTLKSATGGDILLVAPKIENSGLIHAPDGKILLAAGRSVEVADIDRPSIRVEITNTDEQAVNLGTLMARHITIYGGLIRNSGRIQAGSAVVGENGSVTLEAKQRVVLEPTSVIEATGSQGTTGGTVNISAHNSLGLVGGGEVQVQGLVSTRPLLTSLDNNFEPNQPLVLTASAFLAIKKIALTVQPLTPSQAVVQEASAAPVQTQGDAIGYANLADNATGGLPGVMPAVASTGQNPPVPSQPAPGPNAPQTPLRPAPAVPALPVNPASPAAPASPAGGNGVGGSIRISAGGRVEVGDGARLDASGTHGGGEILVGGGWQGLNPNIINSQFTYIASTATLYANADLKGNGGLVVVWANDSARVYGQIAAKGGALGGDGGAIETSGKRFLDVRNVADASAAKGKAGQWLLDPNNVTIQAAGPDANITGDPNFVTTADSSILTIATIEAALNAGINVTITTTTSAGGAEAGDITLNSLIQSTSATDVTLTLIAHNNINLNAGATATGTGKLNLVLNANSLGSGTGAATLANMATLNLNGGAVSSGNGSALTLSSGELINLTLALNSSLNGAVNISGLVVLNAVTTLTANGGVITFAGNFAGTGGILIPTGQTLTLMGNSGVSSVPLDVQGTLVLNLAGGGFGAQINNSGTIRFVGENLTLLCSTCTNRGVIQTIGAGGGQIVGLASVNGQFEQTGTGGLTLINGTYSGTTMLNGSGINFDGFSTFADGSVVNVSAGVSDFSIIRFSALNTTFNQLGTGSLILTTGSFNGTTTLNGSGIIISGAAYGRTTFAEGSVVNGLLKLGSGEIAFGSTTVNGLIDVDQSVSISGTLTANQGITLKNSSFYGSGVSLFLPAGQTLTCTGNCYIRSFSATNFSAHHIGSGYLNIGYGAFSGTTTLTGDGDFYLDNPTFAAGSVVNGSFRAMNLALTGSLVVNGTLSATSEINVAAGATLTVSDLSAPHVVLDVGSTLTVTGQTKISPGRITATGATINASVLIEGGGSSFTDTTVNGLIDYRSGSLSLGGTLVANGGMNWSSVGPIFGGTLQIPVGQELNFNPSGPFSVFNTTLDNRGTAIMASGVNLWSYGKIINSGTLKFSGNQDISISSASSSQLVNTGTIQNIGVGAVYFGEDSTGNSAGGVSSENGTFVNTGGGILRLPGNNTFGGTTTLIGSDIALGGTTQSFSDGSVINGNLNVAYGLTNFGNTVVNGQINYSGEKLNILTGSTLTANGGLTLSGVSNYARGPGNTGIAGGGTLIIPEGQTMTMARSNGVPIYGGTTIDNRGTLSLTDASAVTNGYGITGFSGAYGEATLLNSGTVRNIGSGVVTMDGATLTIINNGGTFAQDGAGSLNLAPGLGGSFSGTTSFMGSNIALTGSMHSFADGSTINGNLKVNGATVNLGNTAVSGALDFSAGVLALTAGKTLTVASGGSLNLATGLALGGGGALVNDGSVTLNNNALSQAVTNRGNMTLNGINTVGAGTVFAQEAGALTLATAGALTKADGSVMWTGGTLVGVADGLAITGTAVLTASGGNKTLNGPTVVANTTQVDTGTLQVLSGVMQTGTTSIASGATLLQNGGSVSTGLLTNNGLVSVQSGTLSVGSFSAASNAGELYVASGATLQHLGGNLTNAGTLSGSGTLDLAGNTLTNTGTIAPGTLADPTGTLQITGNLVLATGGTVQAQLDSTTAGDFDVLAVSGDVNYGGTLSLNGSASSGNIMGVVTSATRTASSAFATVNGSLTGLTANNSATGMALAFGTLGQWTGLGDGFSWADVSNWGAGAVPGALDDVFVATAGPNVVISSGAQSVRSLTTAAGRGLQVSGGGSLELVSTSAIGGNLTLADGNIRGAGTLNVAGAFDSTGISGLSASTTVAGLTTLTSGTLTLGANSTLMVNGGMDWSGALSTISGTGVLGVPVGQTLTLTGVQKVLNPGVTLENLGTTLVNLNSGFGIISSSAATIVNSGNFILAGDANVIVGATVNNTGTFSKTGTGISLLNSGLTLNSTGGTISNTGIGTLEFSASINSTDGTISNTGSGSVVFSGASNVFAGATNFSGINISLGVGAINFADGASMNGTLNNTGSVVTWGDATVINGTINNNTGAPMLMGNTTINGNLNFNNGPMVVRTGKTVTVAAGGSLSMATGMVMSQDGTLINEGTLTLNDNNFSPTVINRGNMVLNGVNRSLVGGFTQEAGTLTLNTAGALTKAGSPMVWSGGALTGVSGGLSLGDTAADLLFTGTGTRVLDGYDLTTNNMTLPGGALNVRSGSLTLNGSSTLAAGSSLNLDGGALTNNGPLTVNGTLGLNAGSFMSNGTIAVGGSGSLTMPTGSTVAWGGSGAVSNTGMLTMVGRTVTNAFDNQGTVYLGSGMVFSQLFSNSGTLVATAGSNTQFNAGLTQSAGGVLTLNAGGTSITGNINLNGGSMGGTGTLIGNVTVGTATLAPGFSPGAITINGNLTMNPASVLNLELGGGVQGSGYDWINVTGTAALNGTLNVSSFDSYAPTAGTTFTVLSFASVSGAFASTVQPNGWGMTGLMGSTSYALQAPTALVGSVVDWKAIDRQQIQLMEQEPLAKLFARLEQTAITEGAVKFVPKRLNSVQKMLEEEGCP